MTTLLMSRFHGAAFHFVASEPLPCQRCRSCHVYLVHVNGETLCLTCADQEVHDESQHPHVVG